MKHLVVSMVITACCLLYWTASSMADPVLKRFYPNKTLGAEFCTNIELTGSLLHIAKFKFWLNEISRNPVGRETLLEIVRSGHTLSIAHADHARISAGRTMAPMTEKLINGQGESVEILFDGRITESGSHLVFNGEKELVEYTAVQNLFHELVHAKHKMKGTWRYFDSEGQAIEEENDFRAELARQQGKGPTKRSWKTGVPIESVVKVVDLARRHYPIRSNPPLTLSSL